MINRIPKAVGHTPLYLNNTIITNEMINEVITDNCGECFITYSGSIKTLNMLFKQLSVVDFPFNIEFSFISSDVYIKNNCFLDIDNLKPNVKLKVVNLTVQDFSGMRSWCRNLTDSDYAIVSKHLFPEDEKYITFEREVGKIFYYKMLERYPNFNAFSSRKKMDICFDYVRDNIKYDHDAIDNNTGDQKRDVDRKTIAEPYYVLRRKKGVCSGRSETLKVLTNNPYMKLKCFTANGEKIGLSHEWNDFIDDDGKVYSYDTSFNEKHNSDFEKCGYTIERRNPEVEEALKKQTTLPGEKPEERVLKYKRYK